MVGPSPPGDGGDDDEDLVGPQPPKPKKRKVFCSAWSAKRILTQTQLIECTEPSQ